MGGAPPLYAFSNDALTDYPHYILTRGAALPQTPLLALIRRKSNVLGFVLTAVIDSGSTGVVVATAVLAAIVAAVLIASLITAVSGSTNSCAQWQY